MKRKDSKNRVLKDGESQRPNGTYEFKTRDSNGKRYSVYAKTLDQLREKEEAILKDRCNGVDSRGYSGTVNDLCEKWFSLQHGRRPTTVETYKATYERYIKDDIGKAKVKTLKRSDIVAFYVRLQKERGIAFSTLNSANSVLSLVFDMAIDDGLINTNLMSGAMKKANSSNGCKKHKKGLTREEQDELERWIPTSPFARYWSIISFMLWTGLRIGEVSALRWSDVDFDNSVIHVRQSLARLYQQDGTQYLINEPKTKSGIRDIPMLDQAREALLAERARQAECGVRESEFAFISKVGTPISVSSMNQHLHDLVEYHNENLSPNQVPLPHMSNHTFRHTFATRMYEAGVSMKAMQTVLGHANISITMDVYTDETLKHVTSELEVLNQGRRTTTYDRTYDNLA